MRALALSKALHEESPGHSGPVLDKIKNAIGEVRTDIAELCDAYVAATADLRALRKRGKPAGQ